MRREKALTRVAWQSKSQPLVWCPYDLVLNEDSPDRLMTVVINSVVFNFERTLESPGEFVQIRLVGCSEFLVQFVRGRPSELHFKHISR